MAVKDVLLALTTYPEPTPVSAVDEAIDFAAAIGARISAIACEVKIRGPVNIMASALLDFPAMAAAETKKSSLNAEIFWPHSKTLRINVEYSRSGYWSIV